MNRFISRVTHLLDGKKEFIIAKIIDSHGSSPRSDGWMLVERSGNIIGSIGGGALEGAVLRLSEEVFAEKKSMCKEFYLNSNDQDGLNMICGGNVNIQIDYVNGEDPKEAAAYREKLREVEEKKEVFVIGAGHVGLALANQLALLEIPAIIIDDREEYANRERFGSAKEVKVLGDFNDVFNGYNLSSDSYIVIVTRGHKWDLEVLEQSLKTDAGYIGMIGSKAKVAASFEKLRQKGFSEEAISKVDAPIGLSIPCETPEEIAVSIAGKLLCAKYGKEVR